MATMWPRVLPKWVLEDPRRSAEIEVYGKLEKELDSVWSVYYSRPWWGISERGGEVDGEADFIVAHPDKGLLFIEVKGGGIDYDPKASQWFSTNRFGVKSRIKNPVEQAVGCKHRFLEKLKSMPEWPGKFIRLRHGVIFPDADERDTKFGFLAGFETQLFCMSRQFANDFGAWIETRLKAHHTQGGPTESAPGQKVVDLLETIVAAPARLHVPLGREVIPILDQQDVLLTGQQLAAVMLLDEIRRALLVGGAGTGKTLVACEMAARLAERSLRVCLVCLTEPLAIWLRYRFRDQPNVTVFEFPRLCEEVIRLSGRRFDGLSVSLPEVACKVLRQKMELPWDAVIVDEGQDFLPEWWEVIEHLVSRERAILRVFYDSNQAVYARKDDLETRLGLQAFPLYNNLRNTKEIGAVAEQLYEGPKIEVRGPSGRKVEFFESDWDAAIARVSERILQLTRDEAISPGGIAVLVPSESVVGAVGRALVAVRVPWARASGAQAGLVTLETVARYKGLEAPVVVLLVDRQSGNNKEMAYVGVSRARAKLEVYGSMSTTLLADALHATAPPAED